MAENSRAAVSDARPIGQMVLAFHRNALQIWFRPCSSGRGGRSVTRARSTPIKRKMKTQKSRKFHLRSETKPVLPSLLVVGTASMDRGRPTNSFPAGATQVVYNTRDEGLQFADGSQQPLRRLRYQTRETWQWRNPSTGASLRVSYPSEEVVLIPVSGQ